MPTPSAATFLDALCKCQLLEPDQLAEASAWQGRIPDAKGLARELLQRGWLTPYQANQVLQGKANELLLKNEDAMFSNFLAWDMTFAGLFDNNVLERDFAGHKRHRKILQSAFRRPSIENHIGIMDPLIRQGLGAIGPGRQAGRRPDRTI